MANTLGSSSSSTNPVNSGQTIALPNPDTIPIIFVPGIMGSNIRNKNTKKPVWRMGNSIGILGTVYSQGSKSPSVLQEELDPLKTEVDTEGPIKADLEQVRLTKEELKKRYWGTVHWDSYGGILSYLQICLNNVNTAFGNSNPSKANTESISQWRILKDSKNLNEIFNPDKSKAFPPILNDEILLLKKFSFPVYGMGYNWLRSNEDAAQDIVKKLDIIKKELGGRFHKFIIVSHSMGGLVTRRIVNLRNSDIAGVVHGAMPADGAPAAYRRIVSGSSEGSLMSAVASNVIGKTSEHITAVLGNSPGGLELLPSAGYRTVDPKTNVANKSWLKLVGRDHLGKTVNVNLPAQNDPYKEIYKRDNVWWEMIKEENLDPANKIAAQPNKKKKENFYTLIEGVKKFHKSIENVYHKTTYVSYGNDTKYMSFGTLTWNMHLPASIKGLTTKQLEFLPGATSSQIQQARSQVIKQTGYTVPGSEKYATQTDGMRYISLSNGLLASFNISKQDAPGDGTVPYQSGIAPGRQNIKQIFSMKGFDHQGAFNNELVRQSTLYSIVKIIKDNNIQPKYR